MGDFKVSTDFVECMCIMREYEEEVSEGHRREGEWEEGRRREGGR